MIGLLSKLLQTKSPQTPRRSFWMPEQASNLAGDVDWVFYFVYWICAFFLVLVTALMLLFVIKYRKRDRASPDAPSHNTLLELTWSVIPLGLVILIFWYGFEVFVDMATPPAQAYEIQVVGQKWNWLFTYPNGYVDADLHVPVDTDVRLVMSSEDVIHSLFIPAFRVKRDVVPGRYSTLWFRATHPGDYDLFCAEYCGTSHSDMLARAIVHPEGEFEPWLEDASNFLDRMSPAEAGGLLYRQRGCQQCHSVDGSPGIAPSFLGLYGKQRQFADGGSLTADENYIRESIVEPMARVVAGYDPAMPSYQGRLSDREIGAIIAYLKTLQ